MPRRGLPDLSESEPVLSSRTVSAARNTASKVLRIEADAIAALIDRLDESFDRAVELLAGCKGRVVVTGMGKSGVICRKIAATLASTGTPALFMHPVDAIHGDLGMVAVGDVVLMLSNSGETEELLRLLETLKRLGVPLVSLVGDPQSTLARHSEIVLNVGIDREACPFGLAPTASTTAGLALGDALALALSERKGFLMEDFARLHPGGVLGKKLARVKDLMHVGEQIPKVALETKMDEVIYEMSRKGLGVAAVVRDDDRLAGVISDGDLRRRFQKEGGQALAKSAQDCMSAKPVCIDADDLAASALHQMEKRKITSLMVTDREARLVGVIHIHDLWGTEIF